MKTMTLAAFMSGKGTAEMKVLASQAGCSSAAIRTALKNGRAANIELTFTNRGKFVSGVEPKKWPNKGGAEKY